MTDSIIGSTLLKETGILEMHVGEDGFGMNFGMGGTDISLGTIATAIQGAQHWRYNSRIESRADQLDLDIAGVLRSQYGFGDIMARKQLDSILDGNTDVKERKGETGEAESVTENGKKVVYLDNYRKGMSREEQLRMGITLQHEAWRDGVVDENNKEETVMAVYAHTKMTERVEEDNRYSDMMKGIVAGDELLTADRKNMAEVDNDIVKFAGYVLEKYDSSGDYWRVLKDGNIVFDGSKDLFDENGRLLRKYEGSGNGGWGASLEEHLNLPSHVKGNDLMVDAHYERMKTDPDGRQYFVDKNDNEVTLDSNYAIQTGADFKAAYNFQMNYADQVLTKFGGSMDAAVSAYKNDVQQKLELGRVAGNIDPVAIGGHQMMDGFGSFAKQYDTAIAKFGGVGDTSDKSSEFNKIKESFATVGRTDSNAMYDIINSTVFPVIGDSEFINITVKAFYEKDDKWLIEKGLAGTAHGQRFGGLGTDLGTRGNNYPVVTTQNETVLAQRGSYEWPQNSAGGLAFISYSENFQQRYLHLQNGTIAQTALQGLISNSSQNYVFRFSLPPGYQIGNVGNTTSTGLSQSEHLHYELNPYNLR